MVVYKASEWENANWHCGSVQDLAHNSGAWWMPARALGISLVDFIKLLQEYGAIIKWSEDAKFLHYHWEDYNSCHKFLLMLNREARKRNFMI